MVQEENKQLVSEAIAQLLLRHNCVIIPHLGGFIGNYTPSRILPHANKIVPPSKALLFNTNLVNNDGLLIQHIADEHGINYTNSEKIVNNFVAAVKHKLKEGNRIELNHVGFLFLQQNDQIGFEQDHSFNMYMNSFGLGSVRFVTFDHKQAQSPVKEVSKVATTISKPTASVVKPVQTPSEEQESLEKVVAKSPADIEKTVQSESQTTASKVIQFTSRPTDEDSEEVVTDTKEQTEASNPRKKSFKWGYAAAAVALPLVFYSLWIPMKSDVLKTKILQFEDFNPFYNAPKEVYEPRSAHYSHELKVWEKDSVDFSKVAKNTQFYNVPFVNGKMVTVRMNTNTPGTSEKEVPVEEKKDITPSANHQFHLITGCFSSKNNAEDLIHQLNQKGFTGIIVDKNKGLYRVSAIQGDSKGAVLQQRASLKNAGFKSWVLEK